VQLPSLPLLNPVLPQWLGGWQRYDNCLVNVKKTRKTAYGVGSRSDRPRDHAHVRWNSVAAAGLGRAESRKLAAHDAQREPTTTATDQYSQDPAVNTRVAHTHFAPTFELDV